MCVSVHTHAYIYVCMCILYTLTTVHILVFLCEFIAFNSFVFNCGLQQITLLLEDFVCYFFIVIIIFVICFYVYIYLHIYIYIPNEMKSSASVQILI